MIPKLLPAVLLLFVSAAFAQTVTKIEQDDPSIQYTGTWYTNTNSLNSGGVSALTNFKGAQAIISFNGTGITWFGATDPGNGVSYVYLDGVMNTVDTYGATTNYQQPLFTARGLTAGPHTLSITVPHIRDDVASGSWVWIDSFQIENGAGIIGGIAANPGRAEQTNPALTYTGVWFTNSAAYLSGGSSALATDANSRASINFNGTGITWLAYRDQWSGIANVYIDGKLATTVDTYASPAVAQYPMYTVTGLTAGTHTLAVEATGTHSGSSNDSWIWVDAFDVAGAASAAPTVSAGGVVSAASFVPAPNNQVAPGQIISVFGTNFLASGSANSTALPLSTQLGVSGASVSMCGKNIPLYSVFPGQINAQVPWECPSTGTTPLTVTANGQTSTAQQVPMAAASPGIFLLSSQGTGLGAILHADNSLVSASSPAHGGETVVVYCTGLGATNPAFATGSAATTANTTASPVTATIGGKSATVAYAGMTLGFTGLYQVNVVVPAGLSGTQPIVLTSVGSSGSVASQSGVTLPLVP